MVHVMSLANPFPVNSASSTSQWIKLLIEKELKAPILRILIIGNYNLTMDLYAAGYKVGFIPDRVFFEEAGNQSKDILYGLEMSGIPNPGSLITVYNAVAMMAARLGKSEQAYNAVIADTDDPWFHPNWWSRICEYKKQYFNDIQALKHILAIGGMLLFRQIELRDPPLTMNKSRLPALWRKNWSEFLVGSNDLDVDGSRWVCSRVT
jgi:hypothetical protein